MTGSETPAEVVPHPPTEVGSEFTIEDFGAEDGGTAISAIREAFSDCWGEKALVLEHDDFRSVYSLKGGRAIFYDHIPEDAYDPEEHGPQTIGSRYHYRFMRELEGSTIRVVKWEDTGFPDIEGVYYP